MYMDVEKEIDDLFFDFDDVVNIDASYHKLHLNVYDSFQMVDELLHFEVLVRMLNNRVLHHLTKYQL